LIGNYIANKELQGLSKMQKVIGVAKHLKENFATKFAIEAIQNGIESGVILNLNSKSTLRKALNWNQNDLYFVYIGSIIKRKNPAFLIEAFLKSNFKQKANLVLVGSGKLLHSLQEKYQTEKSINFVGHQTQITEYLMASDAYVSASFSEGLPLATLEAMSAQLPCLLSNIPAHKELQLAAENATGIQLFQIENTNSLTQLFENFVPFQFEYTVQTAEQMTLAYENLYHQLCLKDGAI
jgi:glycosyltransferase involved in cell wall biosynthesis